jgi:uncharacterized protein (DUF983 family)
MVNNANKSFEAPEVILIVAHVHVVEHVWVHLLLLWHAHVWIHLLLLLLLHHHLLLSLVHLLLIHHLWVLIH